MIKEVFESKSFAVVGASKEEHKVGHIIFKNLISNGINAIPINNNAKEILGKKCYKSLLEAPKVDCVIIAIPAEFVPQILKDMAKKALNNAIIISAGFLEAGNKILNEEIKKIALNNKINIMGPNSLGFMNPHNKVNATFSDIMPKAGDIAFISQSGAIGAAIFDKEINLSGFISIGNSLLVDFSYWIDYFSHDKNTKVITLYIESIGENRGKKFIESCKKCTKPIIALKAGKSSLGNRAASSHTAALASEEGVYEGIFKQAGIIEVDSIRELFDVANLYSKIKLSRKSACIVTNAGGPGVLCSDYLNKYSINIPELPKKLSDKLSKMLPNGWSKNNPVDILGDAKADLYLKTFKILEKENFFDFFIVLLTPQYMTEPDKTADAILKINKKPVIACFMGGKKVKPAIDKLKNKIPVFDELKDMAQGIGKVR
ncbi:MAG: CoA-binding protein [Candidatus Pacearchaeota archaeon]|jgi:acetyltransferase